MANPDSKLRREDRAGHLDPRYAASLRARGEETRVRDDNRAFVDEGIHGSRDGMAAELGEEAVVSMTSGEDDLGDDLDKPVTEEQGGPFVVSTGAEEYAGGTDASNPEGSAREPFPTT